MENTVQPKHNVALVYMNQFARDWIIAKKRGVALVLLAIIHPYKCFSNSHEQNGCHAPLLNNDSNQHLRVSMTLHLGCTISWYLHIADASSIWQLVNAVITNWQTVVLEFVTALLEYTNFLNLKHHICSQIGSRDAILSYTTIIVAQE